MLDLTHPQTTVTHEKMDIFCMETRVIQHVQISTTAKVKTTTVYRVLARMVLFYPLWTVDSVVLDFMTAIHLMV